MSQCVFVPQLLKPESSGLQLGILHTDPEKAMTHCSSCQSLNNRVSICQMEQISAEYTTVEVRLLKLREVMSVFYI